MECDYIGHMDRYSFSGSHSEHCFVICNKERYTHIGVYFINFSNYYICCSE